MLPRPKSLRIVNPLTSVILFYIPIPQGYGKKAFPPEKQFSLLKAQETSFLLFSRTVEGRRDQHKNPRENSEVHFPDSLVARRGEAGVVSLLKSSQVGNCFSGSPLNSTFATFYNFFYFKELCL